MPLPVIHAFLPMILAQLWVTLPSGLERECNREMEKLHKWCYANELQINLKKSEALMIPSQLSAPKTDLIITYIDGPINCLKH